MKTLGIVGGTAPDSTIEYYRLIVASYRDRVRDGSYPSLLINSIDLKKMLDLIGADRLADVTRFLLGELGKLARAGAEFGLLASNTPHIVFDDLARQSPIPLISIVEAACDAAQALGLKRVGLIGTRYENAWDSGRRGDVNHERIAVLGVVAFGQHHLTSFDHYESAWRT